MIEFLTKVRKVELLIHEKNSLKRNYSVKESNFVRNWFYSFSNSRVSKILDTGLKSKRTSHILINN